MASSSSKRRQTMTPKELSKSLFNTRKSFFQSTPISTKKNVNIDSPKTPITIAKDSPSNVLSSKKLTTANDSNLSFEPKTPENGNLRRVIDPVMAKINNDLNSPSAASRIRGQRALKSPGFRKANYEIFDVAHEEQDIITEEERQPYREKTVKEIFEKCRLYVEVRSGEDNRSAGIKTKLRSEGITVNERLTKTITHVIFKEGGLGTYRQAKRLGIPVTTILWIEKCKSMRQLVDPAKFPIFNIDRYENPELYPKMRRQKSMQPAIAKQPKTKVVEEKKKEDELAVLESEDSGGDVTNLITITKRRKIPKKDEVDSFDSSETSSDDSVECNKKPAVVSSPAASVGIPYNKGGLRCQDFNDPAYLEEQAARRGELYIQPRKKRETTYTPLPMTPEEEEKDLRERYQLHLHEQYKRKMAEAAARKQRKESMMDITITNNTAAKENASSNNTPSSGTLCFTNCDIDEMTPITKEAKKTIGFNSTGRIRSSLLNDGMSSTPIFRGNTRKSIVFNSANRIGASTRRSIADISMNVFELNCKALEAQKEEEEGNGDDDFDKVEEMPLKTITTTSTASSSNDDQEIGPTQIPKQNVVRKRKLFTLNSGDETLIECKENLNETKNEKVKRARLEKSLKEAPKPKVKAASAVKVDRRKTISFFKTEKSVSAAKAKKTAPAPLPSKKFVVFTNMSADDKKDLTAVSSFDRRFSKFDMFC